MSAPITTDIDDRILAQLDGLLSPEEEQALFADLAKDPALEQLYEDYRRQERLLERWYSAQAEHIPRENPPLTPEAEKPAAAAVPVRTTRHLPMIAAAAAIVLAASLGTLAVIRGSRAASAEVIATSGRPQVVMQAGLSDLAPARRLPQRPEERLKTGNRGYMEVALPGGTGTFEMNANTSIRLERDGFALEGGEAIVRVEKAGERPTRVATPDLQATTRGGAFGITRGIRGTEVAVLDGEVEVRGNGELRRLRAGETFSTVGSPAMPAAQRASWSRHSATLVASLGAEPPTPPTGDWPPMTPLAKRGSQAAAAPGLQALSSGTATASDTALYLPSSTIAFFELSDLSGILEAQGAANLAEALEPARLRQQLETQGAFANLSERERQQLELLLTTVLADPHVRTVLSAIRGSVSIGMTANAPTVVIDISGHEQQVRDVVQGHFGPLTALAEVQEQVRIDVAGHCLVIGKVGPEVEETIAALRSGTPSAFADGFLAEAHAEAQGSRFIIGVDAARIASGAPEHARKALDRLGIANMRSLVIADRFGDQARNQAVRVRFDGPRRGVAGWLDAPGAMGSLRYFSPNTHAFACAKVEDPAVMLEQVFGWMREDLPGVRTPTSDAELELARNLAASLGNEVAVGLDNPILPVPHIKVVMEVVDPVAFHDSMTALLEALWKSETPAARTMTATTGVYRDRTIVEVKVPGAPVPIAYAVVGDFAVFGPGSAFVRSTIDTVLDRRSLDREPAFVESLPAASGSFASALYYQGVNSSLREALPALSQAMGPSSPELQSSLANLRQGQALVTYAVADGERIDVFVEGVRVGETGTANLLPAVAEMVGR
jgi:ferric-dicitrate binding protein FerR (iron transport regulator)